MQLSLPHSLNLLLVFVLCLSLAACGCGDEGATGGLGNGNLGTPDDDTNNPGGGGGTPTPPPNIVDVLNLSPLVGLGDDNFLLGKAGRMRITGQDFHPTGATVLVFPTASGPGTPLGSGTPAIESQSATEIVCPAPIDASLLGPMGVTVRVTNPDGQFSDHTITYLSNGALPPINISTTAEIDVEASVAINPTLPTQLCTVHELGTIGASIQLRLSANGGTSFVPRLVGAVEDLLSAVAERTAACVIYDALGNLYLCYRVRVLGVSDTIVLLQSSDGGQTFLPAQVVAAGLAGTLGAPRLCTGPAFGVPGQAVYVTWTDDLLNNVMVSGVVTTGLGVAIGVPLLAAIVDDDLLGTPRWPSACVGPTGSLHVTWLLGNDILCDSDSDGLFSAIGGFATDVTVGTSTTGAFTAITATGDFGATAVPSIACIPTGALAGRVVVAYTQTSGGDGQDCVVRSSSDGGATFGAEVTVHAALLGDQFQPALTVDPVRGTLVISWCDTRLDPLGLETTRWCASSTDGGTWGAAVQLALGASVMATGDGDLLDYGLRQAIAIVDGCGVAAWTDNSDILSDAVGAASEIYSCVFLLP